MQRLLHEEHGSVLDFFHRLAGDGREGRILGLRADERQTVNLTGGVRTDDTDIGLHFRRRRVGREVARGRERRASRSASHYVEEHVVTAPPHVAGATRAALLQLREERSDKVLHLLTELRIDVFQEAG